MDQQDEMDYNRFKNLIEKIINFFKIYLEKGYNLSTQRKYKSEKLVGVDIEIKINDSRKQLISLGRYRSDKSLTISWKVYNNSYNYSLVKNCTAEIGESPFIFTKSLIKRVLAEFDNPLNLTEEISSVQSQITNITNQLGNINNMQNQITDITNQLGDIRTALMNILDISDDSIDNHL